MDGKTIGLVNESIIKNNLINLKNIVFEVTEKCNLCCKYCGLSERLYEKHAQREHRDLAFNKAKSLIDYLLNLWEENYVEGTSYPLIISFYGGEPLINMPLIKKIVEYIDASTIRGRKIHYAMTTNGMLLDKHMDFLVQKDFNLAISLDGDENSQSYRIDHQGNNSYKRVMSNIKLLQQNYPEYFKKDQVTFVSVLHNRNDIEPLLNFFEKNFNKTPIILPLSAHSISEDKKEEFWKMYQNKTQSLMKSSNCEAIQEKFFLIMPKGLRLSQFLYYASGNIYHDYNQLLMSKYNKNIISTGTCTPFSKKLFLAVDGKILPCERIDHDFEVGYVDDTTVFIDCHHVAERHNYYLTKIANACKKCFSGKYCFQCMYHIDDIREESIHCPSFCSSEMFEQEKKQNFDYLRLHPEHYETVLNNVTFTL